MMLEVCKLARTCAACVWIGCVMVTLDDGSLCVDEVTAATIGFTHQARELEDCIGRESVYLSEHILDFLKSLDYYDLLLITIKITFKKLWGMVIMYFLYMAMRILYPFIFPMDDDPHPINPLYVREREELAEDPVPDLIPEPIPEAIPPRRRRQTEVEWLRENLQVDAQFREAVP